ncbi:MAG TPA: hypothetical protein VFT69_13080 [Pseudolabrys sp.]|nr:hypothetical protein [Pseudolabrys sp.]
MRRGYRVVMLVSLLAVMPALAGCENFDPDSMDIFGLNAKKKLPGKREALFPSGVPGVTQGIPPEYMKGYKPEAAALPPADADATSAAAAPAAGEAKTAPVAATREADVSKPKPKRRHHVVHRKPKAEPKPAAEPKIANEPKPVPQQAASQPQPGQGTSAPWPSTTPQQTQAGWPAPQQSQAGWPAAQGGQESQKSQKLAPWPSAPPPGTFSK